MPNKFKMKKLLSLINALVNPAVEPAPVKGTKVKRAIRIKIHEEHRVSFYTGKEKHLILNMNSNGIGLSAESFSELPKENQKINGILVIENDSFPLDLEVVYANKHVGCKILSISKECTRKISHYFADELIASKLYPLKTENLKPDPDGTPAYYVGEDSCELFFVENEKKLIKFSLTIFGNYIEIDKNEQVHHGKISIEDDSESNNMSYKKPDLILTSQSALTKENKDKLEKFILNIDNLSHEHKVQMIGLLRKVNP